jgi:ATP-dependent DNA helicase RecG
LKLQINTVSADFSAENSAKNSADKLTLKEKEVFDILLQNPQITTPEIATRLRLPRQTVTSRIKTLKEKDVIRRIGSAKGGHWEIVTK